MNIFKKFFKTKAFALTVSKVQKELLEFFVTNRLDYETWAVAQPHSKVKFQFYYPVAIDFYYGEYKLFTAFFKKGPLDRIELTELKMTETNFDSIRCSNWRPFEEVIIEFLTTLEETKKVALFEKRRNLYEYENLCAKKPATENDQPKDYLNAISSSPLQGLKPST